LAPIKDNIKDFFKTGTLLQNGISLNMGDEDGYVLFSYNRQNTNYVVDKDALSRNSFLFKGGKKFGKFGLDGTVNYISQSVSETEGDLYSDLLQTATNIPVGQFSNPSNEHHWTVYYRSPYWKREALRYDRRSTIFNTTLAANYKFNKNISVNYQVNANFRGSKNEYHNDGFANSLYSYDITSLGYNYGGSTQFTYEDLGGHGVTSSYYVQKTDRRDLNSDLMFNFDYALTDKLNLKLNVGNNLQENYFTQATNGGTGIDKAGIYNVNNLLQLNNVLNAGDESDTPGEFYGTGNKLNNRWTKVRRAALFANADFGYNDYLFLNATARYEKSSVIKKSQFYPSIGLSFIPTKAIEALKDGKVLNHMKIYGSWVRTGNSSVISAYQTDEAPGVFGTGYPFGNLNSYLQQQNQTFNNVNPEYVTTKEIGVNLGFFNNRLGIDAALYQSDTDDLISRSTVSSTSGLATLLTNVGSLTNKGFELDLNVVPVDYKGFRWEFKGSYTTFNTKITSLADGASSLNLQQPYTFVGIFADVNEDFPLIKGTTYMRDPQGNVIVDANGSPIRGSEFKKLGKATPDYILGLTNSFEYKGLKLTAVIDYRTGHQIYSDTKRWLSWSGHLVDSAEFDRNVGFVYPNSVQETSPGVYTQNTTLVNGGGYAGTLNYYSGNYDRTGENFVLDATALKVRELTLSYALPTRWLANTGIQSFRFGVNARNPFVILSDENKGYSDPETSNTNGTATGFSPIGNYPPTRTFGFSMNVNF
jgi:outer membrane receptor protein involved in Fe transport